MGSEVRDDERYREERSGERGEKRWGAGERWGEK